ncbi:hypothetical protein Moror_13741 [Moniliophthora roreri MCA 2997]|uniref:Uncharacterized protein n=1 Tax=Moniliophthora roreri (strain MCA 2997) TaxID=1381753 RepID=V2X989_MONRO|nr:hypothetical protein Moror_13741 [Moniliophthora roreri MCA 2997]
MEKHRNEAKSARPSRSSCESLISEYRELHDLIKEAHLKSDFSKLDASNLLHGQRISWCCHFQPTRQLLQEIDGHAVMQSLVNGEEHHQVWTPKNAEEFPDVASHIRSLNIPITRPRLPPHIIMHDLGAFQENEVLNSRLHGIFDDGNTFLVNASGAGKTRLLFEGLCMHWGLYFPSSLDTSYLGGAELDDVLRKALDMTRGWTGYIDPDSESRIASHEANVRIAHQKLSKVLLSRLLIFKLFIKRAVTAGMVHQHKKRWLELQLHPEVLDYCPGKLYLAICDSFVDPRVIDAAIASTWEEIIDTWDFTHTDRLYMVIDEANYASRAHEYAFREDGDYHPILIEILRCWRRHLKDLPTFFVVAGTEIPRRHFSNDQEWGTFKWCSDTGSFQIVTDQRRYLNQVLPPGFHTTPAGEALLTRVGIWLRGRHRTTASFLISLLENNFQNTHFLLNKYIRDFTKYHPHDHEEPPALKGEQSMTQFSGLDFRSIAPQSSLLKTMLHYALMHSLCLLKGPSDLTATHISLVSQAFGRFVDGDLTIVAIDEPLVLVATAVWFNTGPQSAMDFDAFQAEVIGLDMMEAHPFYYAAVWLTYLTQTERRVSELLSFPSSPPWAEEQCVLVSRTDAIPDARFHYSEGGQKALVIPSRSSADLVAWLKAPSTSTPFCLHGRVLIFALKLADNSSFWVFLHLLTDFSEYKRRIPMEELQAKIQAETESIGVLGDTSTGESREVNDLFSALPNIRSEVGENGILQAVLPLKLRSFMQGLDKADVIEDIVHAVTGIPRERKTPGTEDPSVAHSAIYASDDDDESGRRTPTGSKRSRPSPTPPKASSAVKTSKRSKAGPRERKAAGKKRATKSVPTSKDQPDSSSSLPSSPWYNTRSRTKTSGGSGI